MARPTGFKKAGGGRLNGVDGVIVDYQFTDEFNGEAWAPGKIKLKDGTTMERPHSLNVLVTYRADGAEETGTDNLRAGNFDDFEVSSDGHSLTPLADGNGIFENSPFGKFITSLIGAAKDADLELDTTEFYSDSVDDDLSFASIIGARVRFGQAVQLDRDGKPINRVAKKGKFAGKSFAQTTTIVEAVYELDADVEASAPAKGKGKAAVKGKAKAAPAVDLDEAGSEAVQRYVATAPKTGLAKGRLPMKFMTDKTFKDDAGLRDQLIEWADSDKNLDGIENVTYNAKKQLLVAA